jgi:release factor glutamine methyltransferase
VCIREALARAAAELKKNPHIGTPFLDASLLLSEVLQKDRVWLIAEASRPLDEKDLHKFQSLLRRRCSGESAAYILGRKEFRSLMFTVSPAVLVPRPDTETLVEAALEILKEKKSPTVLELCTGSGAVAAALKNEAPETEIHASDISAAALEIAAANAVRLLPEKSVRFFQADLFTPLLKTESNMKRSFMPLPAAPEEQPLFSLILANPPYVPSSEIEGLSPDVQAEPRIALDGGPDGLSLIRRIIHEAPGHLETGGSLLLEADPRQTESIRTLLVTEGYTDIQTYKDLSGGERVTGAKRGCFKTNLVLKQAQA